MKCCAVGRTHGQRGLIGDRVGETGSRQSGWGVVAVGILLACRMEYGDIGANDKDNKHHKISSD